jgi:hypothetical protein
VAAEAYHATSRRTCASQTVARSRGLQQPTMTRLSLLAIALWLSCTAGFAQGNPSPRAPANDLAHDQHEGVTVSADPYADAARAKEKFGKNNPYEAGVLALDVFLHNDNPQPVHVNVDTVQLEIHLPASGRQDIAWLSAIEVADLIAHPKGPSGPGSRRLPGGIPLPSHDKKTEKIADELRPLTLDSDIIPPNATIHGFLFFNLGHQMSLAKNASLYVPDVTLLPANKTLLFFEVFLGPPEAKQPQ